MNQATPQVDDPRAPSAGAATAGVGARPGEHSALCRLSVRELIGELARVEESLRASPAHGAHHGATGPVPARRELLGRANAIVGELAARRYRGEMHLVCTQ